MKTIGLPRCLISFILPSDVPTYFRGPRCLLIRRAVHFDSGVAEVTRGMVARAVARGIVDRRKAEEARGRECYAPETSKAFHNSEITCSG